MPRYRRCFADWRKTCSAPAVIIAGGAWSAQIVAIVCFVVAPWLLIGLGVIKGRAGLIVIGSAAVAAHILFALVSPHGKTPGSL